MAYCSKCAMTYSSDYRFCKECGAPLVSDPAPPVAGLVETPRFCASCGGPLPAGDRFCPHCGAAIASALWFDRTMPAGTVAPTPPRAPTMAYQATQPVLQFEAPETPPIPTVTPAQGMTAEAARTATYASQAETVPPQTPAFFTTAPAMESTSISAPIDQPGSTLPESVPFSKTMPVVQEPQSGTQPVTPEPPVPLPAAPVLEQLDVAGEVPLAVESPVPEEAAVTSTPGRRSRVGLLVLVAVLVLGLVAGTVGIYKRIQRKREAAKLAQAAQAAAAVQPVAPALAVPAVDEKMKDTIGRMNAMLTAIEAYRSAKKKLPSSLLDLGKVMEDPQMRNDAWGNPLLYLVDLSNNTFVLSSGGPDGKRETSDDLKVDDANLAQWREKNHEIVEEWRVANLDLFQKLSGEQILSDTKAALERKRLEKEKAKAEAAAQQAAALAAQQKHQEELRRQQEAAAAVTAQLAAQQRQQEEARRRVEEELQRQRAEAERRTRVEKLTFTDTFEGGLGRWSTSSFQVVSEKGRPALRVEGFGLLKDGSDWENYTVTFDVKIQKEGVNFIIRARDRQNFYFLKLTDDKAKAYPKNSLIKYVYSGGKYLNAAAINDAVGAAALVTLPFKVKRNEFYRVAISVSGNTIRTSINGQAVDTWQENTFRQGSFGFNCGEQEQATVSTFQMRPN